MAIMPLGNPADSPKLVAIQASLKKFLPLLKLGASLTATPWDDAAVKMLEALTADYQLLADVAGKTSVLS